MMFANCTTLEQLCNEGPVERPDMLRGLAMLGANDGDMATARALSEARMSSASLMQAVNKVRRARTGEPTL